MYFSIVIDGQVVDLFKDETISLNRQMKDLQKLSTIYTDFTQTFQIPASDSNNQIFQNFFDENALLGSWNQNNGLDSEILIHGLPVFQGVVELTEVNFLHGSPSTYSITFYGRTKKAIIDWGETTMREIDWSDYDHLVDNSQVQNSWTGGLFSGDVVWDLKDYGFGFTYSEGNISNNVRKQGTLDFYDLRPSLRLKAVVQDLFNSIGVNLTGTLFARPEFDSLYVTPMDTSGPFVDKFASEYGLVQAVNSSPQPVSVQPSWLVDWQPLPLGDSVISDPSGSWNPSTYEYTIPRSGNYTFLFRITNVSDPNVQLNIKWVKNNQATSYNRSNLSFNWVNDTQILTLSRLSAGDVVKLLYKTNGNFNIEGVWECINSPYSLQPSVIMSRAFPNTKVIDFINSVVEMTNSVLVPISDTEIEIHNLVDWYNSGQVKEYTQYVDFKTITHKKVPIPKVVSFKHADADSYSHDFFNSTYERQFGSVSYKPEVDFPSEEFSVETIFTVFPSTIIREVNQNGIYRKDTTLNWMGVYDQDIKPTKQDFILFHFKPPTTNSYFYFGSSWLMTSPISSNFSDNTTSAYSCAFGLEANVDGDMPINTLYLMYWHEYLSKLYSTRSRVVVVNASIPVGEWINMQLNDTIAISGNYYKIQSITYDIGREYGTLELLTYPNVEILRVVGSIGSKPTYDDPISVNAGRTFLRGEGVKVDIAHAITDGLGSYITDPSQNSALAGLLLPIVDNYLPTITLNKVTIYTTTPYPQTFDNSFLAFSLTDSATEGDTSKYTAIPASGQIQIEADGQYKVFATVVLDITSSAVADVTVLVDGLETEASSSFSGNDIKTINMRMSSTLGKGQVITLASKTGDGSPHTIEILKAYLSIESII
jgi:hypothetical protein